MAIDTSLGVDLALQGADLVLGGNGDYQLVSGPQNLAQAMSLMIPANPGDYVWDPGYGAGIGAMVEDGMSPASIDQRRRSSRRPRSVIRASGRSCRQRSRPSAAARWTCCSR